MRIKLTLRRLDADTEPADLAITVDGAATVADLARTLARAHPVPTRLTDGELAGLTLRVHGTPGAEDHSTRLLRPEALAAATVRAGAVVSLASRGDRGDAPPAARLTVIDGPDAGLAVTLPEGTSVIGRGEGCEVRLSDPTVSKEHARLAVTDIVEIIDLRSANGLLVGDGQVQRAALLPQDAVTLGDTTVTVARIDASRHVASDRVGRHAAPDAVGHHAAPDPAQVEFNRSPRLAPVYEGEEREAPTPPEPPKPAKLPVVMLIVPLLMAPVFLAVGRGALGLVLMAMMPLMVVGHYVDRKVTGRREYRAAVAQFGRSVDLMRTELAAEQERERTTRLAEAPAATDLRTAALALGPLLWTRRPEHEAYLDLRLGLGTLPSRTTVTMPRRGGAVPEHWEMVTALREDFRDVDGVPATAALRASGALGLAGPREVLDDAARAAVVQLVTLHSPAELVLAVVTSAASAARWDWTRWLPHVSSAHSPLEGPHLGSNQAGVIQLVGRIEGLLDARARGSRAEPVLPTVVLIVEDGAPIDRGRLVRIAEEGPAVGIHVLWCAAGQERLPAVCRTFLTVRASAGEGLAGYVRTGAGVRPLVCDTVSAPQAVALARHLAAVVDAGAPVDDASDLPARVPYLDLAGPETAQDPAATLERWRENGSLTPRDGSPPRRRRHDANLRALVGHGATEPFTLDLRTQGPHALVGGTTGAGKSEFLQSWVLGMAAAHSPDRVTFLLVDYKGGSAFADCVDLPHTVGLVTDLSPHLVRRALTSLRAELHFREHLLGRKGAKDLVSLERTGDPGCPPSLVIVVDEFAALATEVPEFVDGVVDVAQRGRSLGLHLVLATQRPAGVIKENLRANTNLRVALRMNDESDSTDVLGLPLAAGFDPSLPGRGAARTGPGRVTMFQAGYAGGHSATAPPGLRVEVETLAMGAGTRWEAPEQPDEVAMASGLDGPTDIRRAVDAIAAAAVRAGVPEPRKPWLPTLAPAWELSALDPRTDSALPLGVLDDPARQQQVTTHYRPDVDGNIAFYGTSGSGKSTALRTLAIAAVIASEGGPVQVYGMDFSSGGLAALEELPHVGSIIDGGDAERVQRLLRRLRDTVEERSVRFAAARSSTIEEYRQIAGRPDEPRILLLVDGYGAFRTDWESVGSRMPYYQLFLQLLVDGRAVGVHVAVTADRVGAIPSSVAGSLPRKVVMRQVDASAYQMLGVAKDVLDETSPPGRAVVGGLEMQVAVLGGSPSLAEQVRAIEQLAAALRRTGVAEAPAVRRLPALVPADTMPQDGRPLVGMAEDTLEPVGIEARGTFLLAGPPQSGRTNALHWLATSIQHAHPEARLLYFGARRSTLRGLGLWEHAATGAAEVAALARSLVADLAEPPPEGRVGAVVVIEALADFLTSPADAPLVELIRAAKRGEHLVIGEGDTSTWGATWPLVTEIRGGRRGMALQPDQIEGDTLFRTAFPRVARQEFPVGRGMLVDRARVRRVQVPLLG